MAQGLRQASRGHGLEVMVSKTSQVELGVNSPSVGLQQKIFYEMPKHVTLTAGSITAD